MTEQTSAPLYQGLNPEKCPKKLSKELLKKNQCCNNVYKTCTIRKPPVPRRTEHPPRASHNQRDFLKEVRKSVLVTKRPEPAFIDSKGHRELLENSGLIPKYTFKKGYGEVPTYLVQRKQEERVAHEETAKCAKEKEEQAAKKRLSEEERQDILQSLKKTWDKVHHEYQGLPFIVDTHSKKAHRERLEAEMAQLEKDIKLLETFKIIYIADK